MSTFFDKLSGSRGRNEINLAAVRTPMRPVRRPEPVVAQEEEEESYPIAPTVQHTPHVQEEEEP